MLNRKSARQCILLFATTLLSFIYVTAQSPTGTVKGTVKDASGTALSGASVTVQGKNIGTATDGSGAYTLQLAPGKYTLSISYVGFQNYITNVTVVGGETIEQSVLLVQSSDLAEVTVGTRSRSPRTAISTPVPVDVIPVAQIVNDVGQVDLNQIMTYLAPSFQSARQTISDGTDHVDPAQLRGLGPTRYWC